MPSLRSVAEYIGQFARQRLPGQVVIQITSRCNAQCPQCGMRKSADIARHNLSDRMIRKILDSCAAQGVQVVSFTGGEPLLMLDDLIQWITYAGDLGIPFIRTGTNGFCFCGAQRAGFSDRIYRLAERLAATPLRNFWISLDANLPQVHEGMRGLPGVVVGIEKALPIFHSLGLYPSANLGINRLVGGDMTNGLNPQKYLDRKVYLEHFYYRYKQALDDFYRFVENLGFSMVNTCYPMSIGTREQQQGLSAVYAATALENIVHFTLDEKAVLYQALLDIIPYHRHRLRIFSPLSSIYRLQRHYEKGAEVSKAYGCRGGVDFFFIDAAKGDTYPCGYRGNENMGKFWELNLKNLASKSDCRRCDWECFRDPSELCAPILDGFKAPLQLMAKMAGDPIYRRLWWSDLNYYRQCDLFDGRRPKNPDGLNAFKTSSISKQRLGKISNFQTASTLDLFSYGYKEIKMPLQKDHVMQIDIHVHSKYSRRPSQWILKKIGCPESFTEPRKLYGIAKERGMSHVTISDHNTIDGALEIAHLHDTFISEEVTTYFPDDGCKVHVLALNITEIHHREIQKMRRNIYDLTQYLKQEKILAVVAHPLYAVNDRLTLTHFEKLLLLFQNFELNGARNARENDCLRSVIKALTKNDIMRLADIHDLKPLYPHAWRKNLWGGSDDHSSLNIARSHTRITGLSDAKGPSADMPDGRLSVVSHPATPLTMGHNLYGIAYQYYSAKFNLNRYAHKDVLMRFLKRNLTVDQSTQLNIIARIYLMRQYRKEQKKKTPVSDSLLALLRNETQKMIQDDPDFFESKRESMDFNHQEQRWYDFVNRASKRLMLHFGNHLLDHLSGANLFNIFSTIGSAGGLYTLLAPYFVAFAQFAKDRSFSETVGRHFGAAQTAAPNKPFQFAHFTDTFYDVNGVAKSLQQQVHWAIKHNKTYTLITCRTDRSDDHPGVLNFTPIGTYDLPEYPEQKICYPPFLEMLAYCYQARIDHIHSATPGPVGLAALAISKILKLPISGTYHTAIPQYAKILTGDDTIEELAWKYVLWYYDQLDVIYVPSKSTGDELTAKGIDAAKIKRYPRGIDVVFYNPAKRNGIFKDTYALPAGFKLLYVGRVSKEKNLNLLATVFKRLVAAGENVQLIIVGDGPYLEEMKAEITGMPCCFTGYLKGKTLAGVYASADLFVFPSTTDTFGNVVLEAQASGLPVIVSDRGGPRENMLLDHTGLICRADDVESLYQAILSLIKNPVRCRAMGRAARRYMKKRSFENAFLKLWELYQEPLNATAPTASVICRRAS